MNETLHDVPKAPRRWLWLARGMLGFFVLLSLLMAGAVLEMYVEGISGQWQAWGPILGFIVCVVALLCGLFPYGLALWNLRSEKSRARGPTEALIIGAFWFFMELITLLDTPFHGASSLGASGAPGDVTLLLEVTLAVLLILTLPGLLLLLSGMKLLNSRGNLMPAPLAFNPAGGPSLLRTSVAGALVLLLFPAVLGLFTLRQELSTTQLILVEALLLASALPYAFVWRNLGKAKLRVQTTKFVSALAAGFLTFLAVVGTSYGFNIWWTWASTPSRLSAWAELVFFALLGLANVTILLAAWRSGQPSGGPYEKKRFVWGGLAICLCLVIYGFFMMVVSASV